MGHAHGMDKSTVSRAITKTVKAINDTFFNDIISWPKSLAEKVQIAEKFYY